MCLNCGCDVAHAHDHPHDHPHASDPDPQSGHGGETPPGRTIQLAEPVLARNMAQATHNRRWLDERGMRAINLISAPGAGKTSLLEQTLERLRGRLSCAVIVGDLQTDHDARRLQGRGARVVQIETRHACHLDATMVHEQLPALLPAGSDTRLLMIENVGNLVCPAAFDLGEHLKIALLSVTEGEDKPLKYPVLFHRAPVVLITKCDLIPHLDWDRRLCRQAIHAVRPDARIFEVSARSGEGMAAWIEWLEELAAPHLSCQSG